MADLALDADRVSAANSSTATLGVGGVFTGTAEDVRAYPTLTVSVFSDVASATNGLSIQFSSNGTNWDHTDTFTIPAATGKVFTIGRVAQFFRLVYTNGGTGQAAFRLQVILNESDVKPSSHRIQDGIVNDDDAELVKSVLTGQNNGAFENVKTNAGRLQVIVTTDAELATEQGNMYAASLLKTVATGGTNILLLRNPSGSGKIVTIQGIAVAAVSDSADSASVRWYGNPTISATGGALAAVNTRFGSANTAGGEAYDGPTHSALGDLFWVQTYTRDSGSETSIDGKIKLQENEDFLLRGFAEGLVSLSLRVSILWSER